jgi:protein-S-isoprenylcysteine O-methyltransferase Ste14
MEIKTGFRYRIAGLVFILFYLALMFGLHFYAAGTGQLPFSWITLGSFALITFLNVFLVEPELISERLQFGGERVNQKDQLLASVSFLFLLPISLIVAGLDCGRFIWTKNLPLPLQISGVILYTLGNLLFRWAMYRNRHFSTFVRIQEDRGHQVESGGPYQYVRHPGYAGAILAALTLPLALGSLVALGPALIGCIGLILRTILEDNQLKSELAGYQEYATKVRFRLLPWVW